MTSRILPVSLLFVLGSVACAAVDAPPEDAALGVSRAAVTMEALSGFVEGSDEAKGILRAANELGDEALGFCTSYPCVYWERAFLMPAARSRLLAFRAGPDHVAGSADDRRFGSLAELRQVVTPDSMDYTLMPDLLTYALVHGWVFSYDPGAIVGFGDADPRASLIVQAANTLDAEHRAFGAQATTPTRERSLAAYAYLPRAVADAIGSARAGADGVEGTSDDVRFTSLSALEAKVLTPQIVASAAGPGAPLPAVRAYVRAALLRFAVANGLKPPAPPPPAWKTAFANGHPLWAVRLEQTLPSNSPYWGRIPLACSVSAKNATITCAAHDFLYSGTTAAIRDDGTFDQSSGKYNENGGELRGFIAPNGTVTVERFRHTICVQTSSKWCETRESDGQNLPASAKAFELCRTPDVTFPAGGWASGYFLACSQCNGKCEGGR